MIDIQKLNKTYDRNRTNENHVLRDISLKLPDTGFVCILGPSGCGKTSLLNAIGGLDEFDSGTLENENIRVDRYGSPLFEAERNRSFGYIFQNYYLLPEHSVGYNVYLGLHSLQLSHRQKLERVREALTAVEMDRYIRRNVAELSGGQQQRVAIARALARRPRVIFADEPTGNLDEANTRNICTILRRISRQSLVVMVTHEERIARFFADRIITLENGQIVSDTQDWQRGSLCDSQSIYTGDYAETQLNADKVTLRIFQEEGCDPVAVSILALKDRIVIKLDDSRIITCTGSQSQPLVVEGKRPVLTLEDVDHAPDAHWSAEETIPVKAGQGIGLREMFTEARYMSRKKGIQSLGTQLFLVVLTVLIALTAADFIFLSTVDPHDFIQTHSQALMVTLERGSGAETTTLGLQRSGDSFKALLAESRLDYAYAPIIANTATVSGSPIYQTSQLTVTLSKFTYTPLELLDEQTLILGRMPENAMEVVVDRWVLDAVLSENGVAQNGITGIDYFLDRQIVYQRGSFYPTIVGICDSGEAAVYITEEMFANLGASATPVASLSALQAAYPGVYDDVTLEAGECIVLPANAGSTYRNKLGAGFTTNGGRRYEIIASIEETDFYAKIVVADDQIPQILLSMSSQQFLIFTQDKQAMTEYLESIPEMMNNAVSVTIEDNYTQQMDTYTGASQLRADSRTIVTATIIAICMVMLYLLRRSQVQQRLGMLAVYRLLGVPNKKTAGIFLMESLISTSVTAVPAAASVWVFIRLAGLIPTWDPELLFPWYAAIAVVMGIVVFHLAVTLLPLRRFMKLPPAQLAAKYDF